MPSPYLRFFLSLAALLSVAPTQGKAAAADSLIKRQEPSHPLPANFRQYPYPPFKDPLYKYPQFEKEGRLREKERMKFLLTGWLRRDAVSEPQRLPDDLVMLIGKTIGAVSIPEEYQIYVKGLSTGPLSLYVTKHTTPEEILNILQIRGLLDIHYDRLLTYGIKKLAIGRTLEDYPTIREDATLHIGGLRDRNQPRLLSLIGQKGFLGYLYSDYGTRTLKAVRQKIEETTRIPAANQLLIYHGERLEAHLKRVKGKEHEELARTEAVPPFFWMVHYRQVPEEKEPLYVGDSRKEELFEEELSNGKKIWKIRDWLGSITFGMLPVLSPRQRVEQARRRQQLVPLRSPLLRSVSNIETGRLFPPLPANFRQYPYPPFKDPLYKDPQFEKEGRLREKERMKFLLTGWLRRDAVSEPQRLPDDLVMLIGKTIGAVSIPEEYQIYVKGLPTGPLSLYVTKHTTSEEILNILQIRGLLDIHYDRWLTYGIKKLEIGRTLEDYPTIREDATLHIGGLRDRNQPRLLSLIGQKGLLSYLHSYCGTRRTLEAVSQEIEEATRIPAANQLLIYHGELLEDHMERVKGKAHGELARTEAVPPFSWMVHYRQVPEEKEPLYVGDGREEKLFEKKLSNGKKVWQIRKRSGSSLL